MLIVATSPEAVAPRGTPDPKLVQALVSIQAAGNPVGVVSNHDEPEWFQGSFAGTHVSFVKQRGRQSGKVISYNAQQYNLSPYDVIVLAIKPEDVQMGKNGGAVLVAAGWSPDRQVRTLGIQVRDADEFREVINLTTGWAGAWWFEGNWARYSVRALADLSTYGKSLTQQQFSQKVTYAVKNGDARLKALLAITARSLLMNGFGTTKKNLVWGVYPSSSSTNDDTEVLSDFTHRLRTTVSRVQYAKHEEPLFIRHIPSVKRSSANSSNRTDPSDQIESIHINPFYKDKRRLYGKHVIVIDDCTTYGVSFGVAAAFLRRAGATEVTGVALGKFGMQQRYYEIDIDANPFAPIPHRGYRVNISSMPSGNTNAGAQGTLRSLIP